MFIILSILPSCKSQTEKSETESKTKSETASKVKNLSEKSQKEICALMESFSFLPNESKKSIKDIKEDDYLKYLIAKGLTGIPGENGIEGDIELIGNQYAIYKAEHIQKALKNAIGSELSENYSYEDYEGGTGYNIKQGLKTTQNFHVALMEEKVSASCNDDSDISVEGSYIRNKTREETDNMIKVKFTAKAKLNKDSETFGGLTFDDYKIISEDVVTEDEEKESEDNKVKDNKAEAEAVETNIKNIKEGKLSEENQKEIVTFIQSAGYVGEKLNVSINDIIKNDDYKYELLEYFILLNKGDIEGNEPENLPQATYLHKAEVVQKFLKDTIGSEMSENYKHEKDQYYFSYDKEGFKYTATDFYEDISIDKMKVVYKSDSDVFIEGSYIIESFDEDNNTTKNTKKFTVEAKINKNSKYFGSLTFKDYKIIS